MPEIVSTPDTLHGKPRIDGTRIGVHHVVERVVYGDDGVPEVAEEIYPHLEVPQVHAAVAYYYEHRAEVDHIREQRRVLHYLLTSDDPDLETVAAVSSLTRETIADLHDRAEQCLTPADVEGASPPKGETDARAEPDLVEEWHGDDAGVDLAEDPSSDR